MNASTQLIDAARGEATRERALSEPPRHAPLSVEIDPAFVRLLGNRFVVIGLLAVAGPLGLPALWFSRKFSKGTKIATTVLFFLATVVAPLALAYYWLEIALRPLVEVFDKAKL